MAACVEQLENTRVQLENAKAEVQKPFPQKEELAAKTARLNELNALLNLDKTEMRSWTVSEVRRSRSALQVIGKDKIEFAQLRWRAFEDTINTERNRGAVNASP